MAADRKGESWAVLAMSEMGKGVWLKQRLAETAPEKLLIWDIAEEYDGLAVQCSTFRELLQGMAASSYALRFCSKAKTTKHLRADFEDFCSLAYAVPGAVIVVEELADVTSPSWAPPAWRKLNTRGRHHQGLTIYFCSQSPAFIDKASLGNATHLHVGYLGEPNHRKAAAAHMGCTPEEINALVQFEYMEYIKASKELSMGKVSIPAGRKRRRV